MDKNSRLVESVSSTSVKEKKKKPLNATVEHFCYELELLLIRNILILMHVAAFEAFREPNAMKIIKDDYCYIFILKILWSVTINNN
jgi:hypothetical protein